MRLDRRQRVSVLRNTLALAFLLVLCASSTLAAGKSVDELIAQAKELLTQREPDLAVGVLRRADKKVQRADVKILLAAAYNQSGKFKKGVAVAREAFDIAGDDEGRAYAQNVLGVSLFAGGQGDEVAMTESAECFARAYELSGQQMHKALLARAEALLQLERDEEARPLLERYLETQPDRLSEGRARGLLDNPESARTPMLPRFSATTLAGTPISGSDLEGKVVLVDFWATWCGPCRKSVPHLKKLSKKRGKKPFEIVGVNSDQDPDKAREFVAQNQIDWPQVWQDDRYLNRALGVKGIPTYLIVDHEGKIVLRTTGWSLSMEMHVERALNRAVRRLERSQKVSEEEGSK